MVNERKFKKLFAKGDRFKRTNHQCATKAGKWGYDGATREDLFRPDVAIGEEIEVKVINHQGGDIVFLTPWGEDAYLAYPKTKEIDIVAKKNGTIEISNAQGKLLTYKPI